MKKNNKALRRTMWLIIGLSFFALFFNDSTYGITNMILSLGLLMAIILGVFYLFRSIFTRNTSTADTSLPYLSDELDAHYHNNGMTDKDIAFFRQTMLETKQHIATLEKNMDDVAKLKAINLKTDVIKASKGLFKELVKEPHKLALADGFLYNHLPNIVELTNKYIEINDHDIKNKNTYEYLNKSAVAIEEVSRLILKDYTSFVSDDLDDLDVELSIANQNLNRQTTIDELHLDKETNDDREQD